MFEGEAPSDSPTVILPAGTHKPINDLLYEAEIVKSKGEGRRLIQQGGVRVDGETVTDIEQLITAASDAEQIIQVGKRKFLRVVNPQ